MRHAEIPNTGAAILDIQIESKRFADTLIIGDFNLTAARGEHLVIMGSSGAGKTTLLKIIAGLDTEFDGAVLHNGQPIEHPSRRRELMFQDSRLLPWYTIYDNVAYGLPDKMGDEDRDKLVRKALDDVTLGDHMYKIPAELSGGMQKRAALARCIANKPDILMLDEPFSGLDIGLRHDLQNLIRTLGNANDLTIVHVTHDIEEAILVADRVVLITDASKGEIQEIEIHHDRSGHQEIQYQADAFKEISAALLRVKT